MMIRVYAVLLALVLVGMVGVVEAAPGVTACVIVYADNMTTYNDKLNACYSLIEQIRVEYNRVSALAASDAGRYIETGKFRRYSLIVEDCLQNILAERNELIEAIRWTNYTVKQWQGISNLTLDMQRVIYRALFGDRMTERVKTTAAICPELEYIKALKLGDLVGAGGLDPTEDFTTYTESDPTSKITINSSRITMSALDTRTDTSYVYKDTGAGYFGGDFEHRIRWNATTLGNFANMHNIMLSNTPDKDAADHRGTYDYIGIAYDRYSPSSDYDVYLEEEDGANFYYDTFNDWVLNTLYYSTFKRNEGEGTYGTIYHYLCTGNYYGESGSSIVDTMSLALHSAKDYRYVYVLSTYDDLGIPYAVTGYHEWLDLQATRPSAWGYVIGV